MSHPDDGREVVLKVQKPDVETVMQTDLGVLYAVVKVLKLTVPTLKFARISPIIDEIKTQMLAETDFMRSKQYRGFLAIFKRHG